MAVAPWRDLELTNRSASAVLRAPNNRWLVSSTERNPVDELELTIRPLPTLPLPLSLFAVQRSRTYRHSPWRTRWPPKKCFRSIALLAAIQRSRTYRYSSWPDWLACFATAERPSRNGRHSLLAAFYAPA